jgi:hypothetical protein
VLPFGRSSPKRKLLILVWSTYAYWQLHVVDNILFFQVFNVARVASFPDIDFDLIGNSSRHDH